LTVDGLIDDQTSREVIVPRGSRLHGMKAGNSKA
jgi:hypothetical protein